MTAQNTIPIEVLKQIMRLEQPGEPRGIYWLPRRCQDPVCVYMHREFNRKHAGERAFRAKIDAKTGEPVSTVMGIMFFEEEIRAALLTGRFPPKAVITNTRPTKP